MRWEYGVTTHVSRVCTTLHATVESLARSGFPTPRIFLDGPMELLPLWLRHYRLHHRETPVYAFGNWSLALYEMLTISPDCNRYAIFQDDIQMCLGVREYLEGMTWRPKTYLNLITYPGNGPPWADKSEGRKGFYKAPRHGKGAQALVFDLDGAMDLLLSRRFMEHRTKTWIFGNQIVGRQDIDGQIHRALCEELGYEELIHDPGLVTHRVDVPSSIREKRQPAVEWAGADWDARVLLRKSS
jgi:hypothetical protein